MLSLIQHFEADFLWKVSLKILNSGIILKQYGYGPRSDCSLRRITKAEDHKGSPQANGSNEVKRIISKMQKCHTIKSENDNNTDIQSYYELLIKHCLFTVHSKKPQHNFDRIIFWLNFIYNQLPDIHSEISSPVD